MYTIMHVLGNWNVKLRCQQQNSGKQNPERGKRTVKQIRLWSTTSFKSKFDLLKVCSRVFLNSDWAEWTLTINLRTAWLHYAYLRLQVPCVLDSLATLRLPTPTTTLSTGQLGYITPTMSAGQLADNNQQLKRNVKDNVKLYCNTRYITWFSSVLLIM